LASFGGKSKCIEVPSRTVRAPEGYGVSSFTNLACRAADPGNGEAVNIDAKCMEVMVLLRAEVEGIHSRRLYLGQVYFPDTSTTLLDARFIDTLDSAFRFKDTTLELLPRPGLASHVLTRPPRYNAKPSECHSRLIWRYSAQAEATCPRASLIPCA
jgi:hypothetical protein